MGVVMVLLRTDRGTLRSSRQPASLTQPTPSTSNAARGPFYARARAQIVKLSVAGDPMVPLSRSFALEDTTDAVAMVVRPHPSAGVVVVLDALSRAPQL